MIFFDYFKQEWKIQEVFTQQENEVIKGIIELKGEALKSDFLEFVEPYLSFMDKKRKNKPLLKDEIKSRVAKHLSKRVILYALRYLERPIYREQQQCNAWLIEENKEQLKKDLQYFKRVEKIVKTQKLSNEAKYQLMNVANEAEYQNKILKTKQELKDLATPPSNKVMRDYEQLKVTYEIIKKNAFTSKEKESSLHYIANLLLDLQEKEFYLMKYTAYYPNNVARLLSKASIKNYLLRINNLYDLRAKTEINTFCSKIFQQFDIKSKKNLIKFS